MQLWLRPCGRARGRVGRIVRWVLAAFLAVGGVLPILAAAPAPLPAASPKTVYILLSRDLAPYREAVAGAKERLDKAGPCRYVEWVITGKNIREHYNIIEQARPDLILTLGTEATKVATTQTDGTPVVFAMVANPVDNGILPRRPYPDQVVAGVTTDVSPAKQFELLQQLAPGVKRVAIIYCPQYTEATVAAGDKAAKALGMELVRFPVEPYRVDEALDKLSKESVDAVWTVTDPGVMVPASAKRILTVALKAKLPVIGFSAAMVRAGALLGFEIDPAAIGRQAGDTAAAILRQGKKPADFNLLYPDTTGLILNAAVAQQIGVVLPEMLAAKAQMVQGE